MTRNVPDLPEALVRKHLQEVLDTCRETNKQPSVLMLARRLDLTNTTFRRRYPDIAREIADHRAAPVAPRSGPTAHDRLVARNAKLRRRNRELTSQLAVAVAQIQFLALRAAKLEEDLKAQTNVTQLADRRPRR
ncbi:hypothetical protein OIC43_42530 [Streptomyces sp. NBC_00825]|uniref:hypothetical protein n=1 Tax=unclassified Streptomyces TaxID=2593676 RepID=UPI00225BFC23|nr:MULTISPECIES: hypothetical protein [unclassified Streptomyces]WTB51898.1 hypothetical protein OG832_01150 [Streptomyces sp. NBC_00826]WTH95211.1 hypothetical protein OIC43_42530 [Streptomyces sp. NBC_00825]WTI03945.1 hypothetical protein OHA23_42505 [Streptomyces sp. NBC_00822]MCX4869530.1 hypothetical protein [Streptomyces sp. NBC_00906]MCX4900769.1 hypothetical protein [Streptomyces sp. NBC_00892]